MQWDIEALALTLAPNERIWGSFRRCGNKEMVSAFGRSASVDGKRRLRAVGVNKENVSGMLCVRSAWRIVWVRFSRRIGVAAAVTYTYIFISEHDFPLTT